MSETVFCVLSRREIQVLQMIAEGMMTKEIAHAMKISSRTIDIHRTRIIRRLEAKNAIHAVAIAIRMGLIQ